MLAALTVRDIVLIEQAALEFAPGLNVLTGETGAGKSILLDSLGLAVGGAWPRRRAPGRGARFGHRHVRSGAGPWRPRSAARPGDGRMKARSCCAAACRRRQIRAFINDEAVSVGLLKDLGGAAAGSAWPGGRSRLVRYLHPSRLLDAFGGLEGDAAERGGALRRLGRGARQHLAALEARAAEAQQECRLCARRGQGIVGFRAQDGRGRERWRANAP